jgi:hypothetical protein
MITLRTSDAPNRGIAEGPNSGTVAVMVFVWITIKPSIFVHATMLKSPDVAVNGILNDNAKISY